MSAFDKWLYPLRYWLMERNIDPEIELTIRVKSRADRDNFLASVKQDVTPNSHEYAQIVDPRFKMEHNEFMFAAIKVRVIVEGEVPF